MANKLNLNKEQMENWDFLMYEAAEEGGYRLHLAIEIGLVDKDLLMKNPEKWFQITQKYYIVPVTLQEIMLATDEATCQLRKAIEQGELDLTLIQNNLEEWFRQTRKFYLP